MRYRNSDIGNCLAIRVIAMCVAFFVFCLVPLNGVAQTGEETVKALVEMGFENVGWTEDETERVYVLQNSAYKIQHVGIAKAVDIIQQLGMPQNKACRIIVLDNNVPQISLTYRPIEGDTVTQAKRGDWNVSYDLGDSWKKARKVKRENSSLFKVDILVYPQLYFKNLIITQIYQVCFEMNPTVEVSLWKGSRVVAQVKLPVYNDGYPGAMENVRPGYLTLEQNLRLPYNIWLKGTVGVFSGSCYGVEVSAIHALKWDNHFTFEGKFGLVGEGYFDSFSKFVYNGRTNHYWSVGANYFWTRYNTQFKARVERYLMKDIGLRGEMIRHFKFASVGFYGLISNKANSNGGFKISIALPPYGKYKRKGYIPRVSTAQTSGITYNAGNESYYYLMPNATIDGSIYKQNQFNPYFIKTEIEN